MSATSEANSLGSFFAVGVQSAKGTAATTLYKLIATDSGLAPEFEYRDTRLEHPSADGTVSWARANTNQITGYIGKATVTFALRPKGIVPVLQGAGFQVVTVNNTTYYTHTLTQGTDAAHKWITAIWKVDDSDAAYYQRGVDGRCTNVTITVNTDEIMCTAEISFLSVAPLSGSPTYVAEQSDEIVPWVGARTSVTAGGYSVVEVLRGAEIGFENTLRDQDKSLWTQTRVNMQRQSINGTCNFTKANLSDSLYEAIYYGADAGSTVATAPVTGAVDVEWRSAANISGAAVPYKLQYAAPSVQWESGGMPMASGDDLITMDINGTVVGNVATPITVTINNNVSSY